MVVAATSSIRHEVASTLSWKVTTVFTHPQYMLITPRSPRVWRYAAAVMATVLAWLVSEFLRPWIVPNPFLLFFGAVAISAWLGGSEAGILATLLSMLVSSYAFIPPFSQLTLDLNTVVRLTGFVLIALLIVALSASRQRAVEEADAARKRLEVTLSSIGDGVIATDPEGRVTFLNGVAQQLTGWTQEHAAGHLIENVFDIVNADTRAQVESPTVRVLREGVIVGLANHTLLISRDGIERPIDDSGAPIRDATGETVGAVLVFRDVTERAQAEAERAVLLQQAQAAVKQRDQFLSVASHELKTPLTSLLMQAQLMERRMAREGTVSQRNREALQAITNQARRLNTMISALLDISRIEQGQLAIMPAPFDLASLTRRVIDELQPTSDNHAIIGRGLEVPIVVNGDELRLEQVLQNLVQNAIKYSPDGGQIEVELAADVSSVEVRVSDQGLGIAAAELPGLFTRFYRASNTQPRNISGMGIGLFVVKEIISLHGGSVSVASSEGKGSTFTVRLPLAAKQF